MKNHQRARDDFFEQELVSSVAGFITIRWLAGAGVLAATLFVDAVLRLSLPLIPLILVGVSILAYNAVFFFVLRRLQRTTTRNISAFHRLTEIQIGLDSLAMAALVHFSGGAESPALFYFFFHIIIAAILLSPRATFLYASAATVLAGAIVWLEYLGWLPHVSLVAGGALYRDPVYVAGVTFFFASAMFVSTYLACTITKRLRRREQEVIDLSENLLLAYNRLQTLYDSAQAINSTLELQQVLDRIAQRTADAMNVRACSIRLLDETGEKLKVAATYGLSDAYVKKGDLVLSQNPLARQVLAGEVIKIADVRTDTRLQYPSHALAEGILSMLSAPLLGKQGPLGLIRAFSAEVDHFTDADASFLVAMASEGSIAIENAIAYRALGQIDEMKSKFVLTVTHELRSPVGVIRSLLRTMTGGYTGPLSDSQTDIINRVLRRADFLQTLIDDLLDLAAGKNQMKLKEEREAVCLDDALGQVVERYETEAREKQIALELRTRTSELSMIIATPDGIDRVFDNLLSNAVKYTPEGGTVSVHLGTERDMARVEVADTGIGIPEESLNHLYEEFYRAPNAKAKVKEGTGLGLAICKELVTRYGGNITFHSKAGQGTTFVVTLPLATESAS
jgi:signal transduction histidine kinase